MTDQSRDPPPTWQKWKEKHGPLAVATGVEWLSQHVVYWGSNSDFVKLLELAGKFTILIAVLSWFLGASDRAKERHYRAWGVVNTARDATGDGGRFDALTDLNNDQISLAASPLDKAYLAHISLPNANLSGATLVNSNLIGANLNGANLSGAKLSTATLASANLKKANLSNTVLTGANLIAADLTEANLSGATIDLNDIQVKKALFCRTVLPDGTLNNSNC